MPLIQFDHTANEKKRGSGGTFFTNAILKLTDSRIEVLRTAGLQKSVQLVDCVGKADGAGAEAERHTQLR